MEMNQLILILSLCLQAYANTISNHMAVVIARNYVLKEVVLKIGSTNKDIFSLIILIFNKFRFIHHLLAVQYLE